MSHNAKRHASRARDRALGMDRPISRRDFLNGMAIGGLALGATAAGPLRAALSTDPGTAIARAAQDVPGYYPPLLTGLRGSHPGAFEEAHALRDGRTPPAATDTGEQYDLVVVGAGISGLAAAHFYRAQAPKSRILILDNHDDFGGHAKRNEFNLDGRLHLMNGGTLEIGSPRPYGPIPAGLLKTLGIDVPALVKTSQKTKFYSGLGLHSATFFDQETFGADKLVVGLGGDDASLRATPAHLESLLAQAPLSARARREILQIETATLDYMPGESSAAKKERMARMSYDAFLRDVIKVDPAVRSFYSARTHGDWGVGIDAVSALDCWGYGLPGFRGMNLSKASTAHMSFTPAGYHDTGGSPILHFPDGNATVARLLVRDLIPQAVPGHDVSDVITAVVDYSRLDTERAPVRLRLNGTVVRVRHLGDPASAGLVEVVYMRQGRAYTVRTRGAVLAGYNMMIPYLCPELPEPQKKALHALIKTPLVYTTVALRNWQAFAALKASHVYAPGSYHSSIALNQHVELGAYHSTRSPEDPILVHMTRTPCKPGMSELDQHVAGRKELFETSFDTFERHIREQLGRTLQPGGFDPARDITAITVNRWPHGYAPEHNPLWDPDIPEAQRPHVLGRAQFGRISIANSDAGGAAYTDVAISQGHRAAMELLHAGRA